MPQLKELLLLMLKLADVVVPPESPNLQHILEFWEPLEYFV